MEEDLLTEEEEQQQEKAPQEEEQGKKPSTASQPPAKKQGSQSASSPARDPPGPFDCLLLAAVSLACLSAGTGTEPNLSRGGACVWPSKQWVDNNPFFVACSSMDSTTTTHSPKAC